MRSKIVIVILSVLASVSSFCQQPVSPKSADKAGVVFNENFRSRISSPPYGLEKIRQNIASAKYGFSDEGPNKKFYQSLSLREKFTYNMVHGETYSQNCSAFAIPGPGDKNKIFAQLPDLFGEYGWSEKQRKFFNANRDSVIYLIKDCISKTNEVGLNFKEVISDINAKELVPLLINTYMITKKDHDILTLLMLLMVVGKYQPFLSTVEFIQLYNDNNNYTTSIAFNAATQNFVIKLATDFYHANGQ